MLSIEQATTALLQMEPSVQVQAVVRYRNVYLFRVMFSSPGEEDYDPFFSVDWTTGEVRDFSILTDGDISEITPLFQNAKKGRS